ncbi:MULTISPECIES: hypothetical protein [Bacillus]|uniref:hypothetical protein n=1 Tax=Bacillus TaxID=1386 RepID=UPI00041C270A|nr:MULTISPECIES: hypothetical protein [Bacillus]QHZ47239.1 hypothetical protein M654_013510 [Bacillus sp. NSP9.1]WFA03299.1 hypothetical protein P3X63_11325 [Bacillus sp. HSf4]
MQWLEFVSAAIESLAWPVTILSVILLLRGPLSERMRDLIKLKYKDFELEFDKRVKELASAGEKTVLPGALSKEENIIEKAWSEVEDALRQTAKRFDPGAEDQDVQHLIKMLHEQGVYTKETASVLSELSILRHAVLSEVSLSGAFAYKKLCRQEAGQIRAMAEKHPVL